MYSVSYKPKILQIIFLSFLFIVFIVAGYCSLAKYLYDYYHITSIFLLMLCISILIRAVGIFIMYPGSYRYLAAQVQFSENQLLLRNINRDMKVIESVSSKIIAQDKANTYQYFDHRTIASINTQLNVISKSSNPDQNKLTLIQLYKKLIEQLNNDGQVEKAKKQVQQLNIQKIKNIIGSAKQQQNHMISESNQNKHKPFSIAKIILNPYLIQQVEQKKQLQQLKKRAKNTLNLCRRIWKLCIQICKIPTIDKQDYKLEQFVKPDNTRQKVITNVDKYQVANWQMFTEKLFTLDSYFGYWDDVLIYQRVMVPLNDDNSDFIQCVIIHGQKKQNKPNKDKQSPTNKMNQKFKNIAAMICNPNAVFLQGFGLTSSYVNFYLKWGVKVVLWNYRGYGKSTGIASVTKCISDVEKVYKYLISKHNLSIQILHGYSIGGIAAISLVNKVNLEQNNPIKLLIADRTFSSLDKVAEGFIKKKNILAKSLRKITRPFMKLFFYSECIDMTEKFISCKCNKLSIYDTLDEVISRSASLRQSLIKQAFEKKQKLEEQNNSEKQKLIEQQQFTKVKLKDQALQFAESICKIYQKDKQLCQNILKVFEDIKVGGEDIQLINPKTNRAPKQKQLSKSQIKQKCLRYFVSLTIYGINQCLPYYINQSSYQNYVTNLFQQKINTIKQICESLVFRDKQIIDKLIYTIQYIKYQLKLNQINKNKKNYGQIVISSVGHNNQIKKQYYFLEKALDNYVLKKNDQQQSNSENKKNIQIQEENIQFSKMI